ncbi:hypothetical protein OUZ56_029592 [Daphnia magna]|uniref:Uncharacterized protein n=1 Tax=Daphnia magna TaxID=35525 RepID=A0ABR0B7B1_9CRUS|nr:hypothetical protein OUZ56_029592 [Daphnia magna]
MLGNSAEHYLGNDDVDAHRNTFGSHQSRGPPRAIKAAEHKQRRDALRQAQLKERREIQARLQAKNQQKTKSAVENCLSPSSTESSKALITNTKQLVNIVVSSDQEDEFVVELETDPSELF